MDNKKALPVGLPVRRSKEIKLKDKKGRNFVVIRLTDFGFIPEHLIIEKVFGETNKFVIMAVKTDAVIKKEEEEHKKWLAEKNKKGGVQHGEPATAEPGPQKEGGS